MAEYIDKQAFLDYMKGTSRYFNVKFDIENFPIADVVPVQHGRWVMHKDELGLTSECSACHIETMCNGNYCPNCGAKMDGGNDAPTVGGRLIDADTLLQQLEEDRPYNWGDSEAEMQAVRDWEYFRNMVEAQTKQ